ncbi:MAG: hypothetical protein Q4E62_09315, partial [Sutterellaceae bacterium]|nr:hypothetical protein [Sutterellaceae bacterium]
MKTRFTCLVAASLLGLSCATMAADVPTEAQVKEITASLLKTGGTVFPIGVDNVAYEKYFTGKTFLAP